jgi:Spy/CpxP family protein refolding chaperone
VKKGLYIAALLCVGFALGWVGRGFFHPMHGPRGGPFGMFMPHGPGGGRGLPPLDRMLDDAEVTPEQRTQIRAIEEKHHAALSAGREKLEAARHEFESKLPTDESQAALQERYQALLDAKRSTELEHFAMMMEVRSALTPEQRQRLEHARESHRREMRGP